MSYIERERQRQEAVQQEQLDWLHVHNLELREQTRLLRVIATHTRLQYVWTWVSIIASPIAVIVLVGMEVPTDLRGPVIGGGVLVLTLIMAIVFGAKTMPGHTPEDH